MDREFPEPDWKIFRELRQLALDRFCQRVLADLSSLAADSNKTHHERFLAVFNLVQQQNEELADTFDNPRRSVALIQLARIRSQKLLTEEEFSRFSSQTRELIDGLLASIRSPRLVQSEKAADFIKAVIPETTDAGV